MSDIGRNDPCWCGSGKKYKKCHFAEDQRKAVERMETQKKHMARLEAMGSPSDTEMRGMYEEMTGRTVPAGPLNAEARDMLTEIWQQQKLNAQNIELLEPHKAEWEAYFADHADEFETIATEVGQDPFFNDYELTEKNAAKVRQELGELPEDEDALKTFTDEAIRITLDEDDRTSFRDAILSRLTDLVDADNWKTAYVVSTVAERAIDPEAPVSPLLRDVIIRSLRKQPA